MRLPYWIAAIMVLYLRRQDQCAGMINAICEAQTMKRSHVSTCDLAACWCEIEPDAQFELPLASTPTMTGQCAELRTLSLTVAAAPRKRL